MRVSRTKTAKVIASPPPSSKRGRPKFSAVKQLGNGLPYYKARQLAALGEFADNGYFSLVEEARSLHEMRALSNKKRAEFPDDVAFAANFNKGDFDRAWGHFHNRMNLYADALMRLDPQPFVEVARAIEAFKEIRAQGGPHVIQRYALDFAAEHGLYPVDEKNTANPKFTFREFKVQLEDWILKQREILAALKVRGTDKKPQPSTRLELGDRQLRRILKKQLGIPLKPDKVGPRGSR